MGLQDQRPKLLGVLKDSAVGLDVVTINSIWADLVSGIEQGDIHVCVGSQVVSKLFI